MRLSEGRVQVYVHFFDDVGARGLHEEVPVVLVLRGAVGWGRDEAVAVADVDGYGLDGAGGGLGGLGAGGFLEALEVGSWVFGLESGGSLLVGFGGREGAAHGTTGFEVGDRVEGNGLFVNVDDCHGCCE